MGVLPRETASGAVHSTRKWCDCVAGQSRGRMSASWATCTQVWEPLVGRRQNSSLWCTTTMPSTAWTSRTRWRGRTPSKAVRKVGQWRSSITSTRLGSMPTSYSRSAPAAGEPRGKLRAEYNEGKRAAAVATRWAAAEATTAATSEAAGMETEAVLVRKSCKRNQTSDSWQCFPYHCTGLVGRQAKETGRQAKKNKKSICQKISHLSIYL